MAWEPSTIAENDEVHPPLLGNAQDLALRASPGEDGVGGLTSAAQPVRHCCLDLGLAPFDSLTQACLRSLTPRTPTRKPAERPAYLLYRPCVRRVQDHPLSAGRERLSYGAQHLADAIAVETDQNYHLTTNQSASVAATSTGGIVSRPTLM